MNFIAVIILITLLIDFVLHLSADYLNLKGLQSDLPDAFTGVYDPDSYRKSQEYLRVNTRFGWITGTFNVVVVLVFWFSGGFNLLDHWVRAFSFGPIPAGLIYIGMLMLIRTILFLPFNIYDTFVIEERFGFNKTTPKTFVLDLLKTLGLSVLLGGIVLSGVLAFFQYTGDNAWWYCWIGVSVFMLAMQYIAPTWIMPLFNKYEPLEDGELRNAIFSYAGKIKFSLNNVFVMDGSRRSAKSNAYFTGFGKHKRIVLFDTLIEKHSVPELVGVLAHEMGHFKKKHILKMTALGIVQMGFLFYLLSFFISFDKLFEAFYVDQPSVYAGLIFFGMLYTPLDFFIGFFSQMISRKNEYEADRFASETTKDPMSMIHALKKLSAHNLSNLTPHPFYVLLNYSHPPVLNRVKALEQVR
jgi:STE24 endopeptidase